MKLFGYEILFRKFCLLEKMNGFHNNSLLLQSVGQGLSPA
jgi:hypothetical protein